MPQTRVGTENSQNAKEFAQQLADTGDRSSKHKDFRPQTRVGTENPQVATEFAQQPAETGDGTSKQRSLHINQQRLERVRLSIRISGHKRELALKINSRKR
jgi:hypothetical protein